MHTTMAVVNKKSARAHTHTHRWFPVVTEFSVVVYSTYARHPSSFFALCVFFLHPCSCMPFFSSWSWSCYSSFSCCCFRLPQMLYDKISSHFLDRFKNPHAIFIDGMWYWNVSYNWNTGSELTLIQMFAHTHMRVCCVCVCVFKHIMYISLAASYKHSCFFPFVFGIW